MIDTDVPGAARDLDAIGLAEITARAGLLTRRDRKYLLPAAELGDLLAGIEPGARVLEIDGLRQFGYESVYFDSPDLTSYLAAARGRRRRFKVRTRTYLDTDDCYVEVKVRGPRGVTVKSRAPYRVDERGTLAADGWAFAREVLADETARPAAPALPAPALPAPAPPAPALPVLPGPPLVATLVSRFERVSLFLPSTAARATIDTALAWSTPGGQDAWALPGVAVVETKTGSTPSSLDRLLWRAGHRPVRLSKYGTGMAVLHPELPATRWRHTLDHLPVIA